MASEASDLTQSHITEWQRIGLFAEGNLQVDRQISVTSRPHP